MPFGGIYHRTGSTAVRKGEINVKEKKTLHRRMERWEFISLGLLLYDALAVNAAYFLALWLRYDMRYSAIPPEYLAAFLRFAPVYTAVCLAVFFLLRLYNSLWRFASFNELARSLGATAITCVFHWVGMNAFVCRMPVAYYVIGALGQFLMVTAIRFAYRFIRLLSASRRKNARAVHNAMIIGAGAAGQAVLRELKTSEAADAVPRCIIDDDPNKWGRTIDGVPVVGGREVIAETAERYGVDQILIAIPTLSMQERGRLLTLCSETGCRLKTLPALYQLANGEVSLNKLRPVAVEDLLGRPPISVEMGEIFAQIQGRTILVTGGGGSIGSELCRQIAAHDPKRLMIFDIYENNAYAIQQELRRKYPALELTVLIGSVRDSRRIQAVFQEYRPEVVFHAAAHKHVPLMEGSPNEAIKNNVLGTYKTAFAALKYGARRFVLISTDKAVNPTNIMGASKRLCEMVVQAMDRVSCTGEYGLLPELGRGEESHSDMQGGTRFVAVRFGNVLGSNGSVVPLFKRQIETGGPVTVTHPDIIRYFMTIPEAVSLVLQAGVYAKGGEIFVLDMGEPVKIDTLARNLIRLSGLRPDEDIRIEYIGLRPGEKLYEEKLMAEEGLEKTANDLIHIGKPVPFRYETFFDGLTALKAAAEANCGDIEERVAAIVSTYHPSRKANNRRRGRSPFRGAAAVGIGTCRRGIRSWKREVCVYDLCIFAAAVQQPVPVAAPVRRHGVLPQAIDCRPGAGVPAAVRRGRHGGTEPAGGAQPAAGGAHYEKVLHPGG